MGKYGPSKLNYLYSDWHYKKLNRKCYATDIDMVELRGEYPDNLKIKALFDIKDDNSEYDKELTLVAKAAYEEIGREKNIPIYVVFITSELKSFRVIRIGESYKYEKRNKVIAPNICPYCGKECFENENAEFFCNYCDDKERIFTEDEYIAWLNNDNFNDKF